MQYGMLLNRLYDGFAGVWVIFVFRTVLNYGLKNC